MVPLEWKVFDIVSVMLHCHMMPAIALFGQQPFYRYILIEYFGSIKLKDIRTCTTLERKGLDCGIYKNIIWKLSELFHSGFAYLDRFLRHWQVEKPAALLSGLQWRSHTAWPSGQAPTCLAVLCVLEYRRRQCVSSVTVTPIKALKAFCPVTGAGGKRPASVAILAKVPGNQPLAWERR